MKIDTVRALAYSSLVVVNDYSASPVLFFEKECHGHHRPERANSSRPSGYPAEKALYRGHYAWDRAGHLWLRPCDPGPSGGSCEGRSGGGLPALRLRVGLRQ